jgi:hypothetical protein
LVQKSETINDVPVLTDLAVDDAVHADPTQFDRSPGRSQTRERASVRSANDPTTHETIALGDDILGVDPPIRKRRPHLTDQATHSVRAIDRLWRRRVVPDVVRMEDLVERPRVSTMPHVIDQAPVDSE